MSSIRRKESQDLFEIRGNRERPRLDVSANGLRVGVQLNASAGEERIANHGVVVREGAIHRSIRRHPLQV